MKYPLRLHRPYVCVLAMAVLSYTAAAQTYTTLYTLGSDPNDPINPFSIGLMSQGRDGNIYSTSQAGGAKLHKSGAGFFFTPQGALTRIWDFDPYPAPSTPSSGLTMGTDGLFYGTTTTGGSHLVGTVFSLTSGGTFTTLFNFTGGTDEGVPQAAPVLGPDGNLYGTSDGVYAGTYGTAYKITTKGMLTTIHPFQFTDGATPYQLIAGIDGNFYGVARGGGSKNMGVVFRMTKAGAVKVLHSFTGYPADGSLPVGTLAQANDGTLYGTTYQGGTKNWGIIFKISPAGTGYTILHNFDRTLSIVDGIQPLAGMVVGTDGNLYGTTSSGGKQNSGALFKITSAGTYTTLYSFCAVAGCKDGLSPQTPILQHSNGKFYGLTRGNSLGGGVFYSLDANLKPFVSLVSVWGKVGTNVEILGQGFNGATAVKVGATAAKFTIVSDTYMTAIVPAGTSGFVTVTTAAGTLTSNRKFFVAPTISSISPVSGPVGTQVVINGNGLINASKVTISGKSATFTINSDIKITAAVPAGAVTGKFTITTPGGTVTSATTFTVTP